ncbi:hypothetical protein ACQ4PT_004305 [Festuca glaucescens]
MTDATSPCRWSAKRYILAALAGTLVLTILVIVVSVVLSPAEIHFSITDTRSSGSDERRLNLTLTANNTSHRAGVKYQSVIVNLLYTPTVTKRDTYLPLDQVSPPSGQSPRSTARISLSVSIPHELWESDFANNATPIGVLVDTVVRFKYGLLYTRSYDIRVLCNRANYFSRSRTRLPINCYDH